MSLLTPYHVLRIWALLQGGVVDSLQPTASQHMIPAGLLDFAESSNMCEARNMPDGGYPSTVHRVSSSLGWEFSALNNSCMKKHRMTSYFEERSGAKTEDSAMLAIAVIIGGLPLLWRC